MAFGQVLEKGGTSCLLVGNYTRTTIGQKKPQTTNHKTKTNQDNYILFSATVYYSEEYQVAFHNNCVFLSASFLLGGCLKTSLMFRSCLMLHPAVIHNCCFT